jgi:hypothetical protein
MINLGQEVKDRLTGFSGFVMGRTEYLNGCVSIGVMPKELKEGKPQDWIWFDEQRLDENSQVKVGGPQPQPPQVN